MPDPYTYAISNAGNPNTGVTGGLPPSQPTMGGQPRFLPTSGMGRMGPQMPTQPGMNPLAGMAQRMGQGLGTFTPMPQQGGWGIGGQYLPPPQAQMPTGQPQGPSQSQAQVGATPPGAEPQMPTFPGFSPPPSAGRVTSAGVTRDALPVGPQGGTVPGLGTVGVPVAPMPMLTQGQTWGGLGTAGQVGAMPPQLQAIMQLRQMLMGPGMSGQWAGGMGLPTSGLAPMQNGPNSGLGGQGGGSGLYQGQNPLAGLFGGGALASPAMLPTSPKMAPLPMYPTDDQMRQPFMRPVGGPGGGMGGGR